MAKTTQKKNTTKKEIEKKKTTTKKVVKKETKKIEEPKKKEVKKVEEPKKVEVKKNIFTKKNIIIASSILIFLILVLVIILCLVNPRNVATRKMKKMGKEYYTEYFYKVLSDGRKDSEVKEILSRYKDTGIKINIRNLSQYSDGKFKKETDSLDKCNKEKTKVIIYPKKGYKKNNYKVKVELVCEF